MKWRRFFHQMAAEQGQAGRAALEMKLEVEKLQVRRVMSKGGGCAAGDVVLEVASGCRGPTAALTCDTSEPGAVRPPEPLDRDGSFGGRRPWPSSASQPRQRASTGSWVRTWA